MSDHDRCDVRIDAHPNSEQKGFVTDVVVPIAQSAVGGAVGAAVAAKLAKGSKDDGK